MSQQQIQFRPANADPLVRVSASVWSVAPKGGYFVVPLDGGPRRFVLVRKQRHVWTEVAG